MGLYEKNIEALKKRNPHAAELIESAEINEDQIKVIQTESGDYRVLYRRENGEYTFINGDNDAPERAKTAIGQFGGLGKDGVVILFGFEFGYFAEEILNRLEKGQILFVYEAVPAIFKAAIMTKDISDLLVSERVNFIVGEDVEDFSVFHKEYGRVNNGMFFVIKDNLSVRLNNDAYEVFYKRLKEEKRMIDSCAATLLQLSKEFINTFLLNIPSILTNPGVDKLKDIFKDRPAVVVSAGPSIDNNFHLLRKIKGKAVIIAVDAIVPTLLPCGIVPDIIVGIDPLEHNMCMLEDNPLLNDVPLVCLGQYTSEIVQLYPGPLFVSNVRNNIVYKWLERFLEDKGSIECFGGSVAHFGFSVAEIMGCDVIALVGQDLSYNEYMHSKGFRDALWETCDDVLDNDVKTQNIFGETVNTDASFIAYRIAFENKIKKFKGKVINATEGGLSIEGAISMRFMDFIEEYCGDLPGIDTFSMLSGFSKDTLDSYKLEGIITELVAGKGTFNDIRNTSQNILGCIEEVKRLIKNGKQESKRFRKVLNNLDVLVEKAKHPLFDILQAYHLELFIKKQSMQGIEETKDRWKKLEKKLELGAKHYSEVVIAIDLLGERLTKLINILQMEKKAGIILADKSLEESEKLLKAGMVYRKAGMISNAVKYLESAVSRRKEVVGDMDGGSQHIGHNEEVYVSLAEMYLLQFRFYEAREMLQSVDIMQLAVVSSQKVAELLETCNEKINVWEGRKKDMTKFLKDAEANYGGRRESGDFYLKIKDYERAEKSFLAASTENKRGAVESLLLTEGGMGEPATASTTDSQSSIINSSYGIGNAHRALDKKKKSKDTLAEIIENVPVNTGNYYHSK